ncbi:MAG TPA: hypothetical protein V6C84_03910 [Coleofasciculaceae cyanobacterium]
MTPCSKLAKTLVTAIGLILTPYQVGGTVQLDWKCTDFHLFFLIK